MNIHRAYKYRIYPNPAQREKLAQQFGCARFVYNAYLRARIDNYAHTGAGLSYADTARHLTCLKKSVIWLKATVHSQVLQQTLMDLDKAFGAFFAGRSQFPRFKRKFDKQSCRFPQGFRLDIAGEQKRIYLPKVGWVKLVYHRTICGTIRQVTVSKTKTGKYYVSCLAEETVAEPVFQGGMIGVDVGLTHFAVTSDGEKINNPRWLRRAEKRLSRLQRRLSRRQKSSGGWRKAKQAIARQHEKVANQRKDFQHKLSRQWVNENQVIFLEALNVSGMLRNRRLAKSISDASWGQFIRFLTYKGGWYGCDVVRIDRFYPSSQLCSVCGYRNKGLTLQERTWQCPDCGAIHDRDINAAINIRQYYGTAGTVETAGNAGGEGVVHRLPVGQSLNETGSYRLSAGM